MPETAARAAKACTCVLHTRRIIAIERSEREVSAVVKIQSRLRGRQVRRELDLSPVPESELGQKHGRYGIHLPRLGSRKK